MDYKKILDHFLTPSSDPRRSDLVLINSCGVVEKTERKVLKAIKDHKKEGRFVILTGCLPSFSSINLRAITDELVFSRDFKKLWNILHELKGGGQQPHAFLERSSSKQMTSIVPISWGCLGNCSYCAARLARGKLKSRNQEEIMNEIFFLLEKGCKEIQLTSQDLSIYGLDRGEQEIVELLSKIAKIKGDFKVRLGMANPGHTKEIFPELLELLKEERFYKYFHIPVQSGDNAILKKMKRNHTVEDFTEMVKETLGMFDDFLIATDIIVGFPGETEESFKKTYRLIEEVRPHIVNITKFSSRLGTEAAKMKGVSEDVKKRRSKVLSELTKKIRLEQNEKLKGRTFKVLFAEKGKGGTILSRTPSYRALILKEGEVGKFGKAKVLGYEHNYLKGEVV